MEQERISVIVPAYNLAPYLGASLDSLLSQTYPNLEIIVVDDGSRDETAGVIRTYSGKYPQIKGVFQENGGVTAARLAGAVQATGEWLGFMDGDDRVEPQMYARLLENAKSTGADISHCGHQLHFPDGRIEYVHGSDEIRVRNCDTGLRELLDNRLVSLSLCTKLYRRELFAGLDEWMPRDIRYNEDLLMNYYLFSRAKTSVFEGICPYHYLLRKDSASCRGISEAYIFDPIRVRRLLLERCSPQLKDMCQQALVRNLLFNYAQLTVHPEARQYDRFRQRVRQMLREEQKSFSLLSVRNRILANMICAAPWSFRLAYSVYVALFQREQQH